jgi:hypothetical protein
MHSPDPSSRPLKTRRDVVTLVVAVLSIVGCSTGGGASGCSSLSPIPSGRYTGPKNDNAVNVRLSPDGVNYLNSHWQDLVSAFAPGNTLALPVPCTPQTISVVGDIIIADQGDAAGNGRLDGQCSGDVPANVVATITGFQLVPTPTDTVTATLDLTIDTGNIYVDTVSRHHGACTYLSAAECSLRFNTAASGTADNRLGLQVKFSIDSKWDKLLAFNISGLNGTQICGASGAPSQPDCFDPADINLSGENTCGNVYCGLADWDPLKQLVLGLLSPTLQSQIQAKLATQSCMACGTGLPACPVSTDGSNAQANCVSGVCTDPATSKCVPRFLGTEGRASLGAVLGGFGAPPDAAMDLSLALGSSVTVDQGLSFGTRVGLQAVQTAACVPVLAAPPMTVVAAPDFDGEATAGSGYHVGLSFSSSFLNNTFYQVHQAGALCLQLNTATVGLVNTGLFKTFLPSLGRLATRDGKDAPMMVALRPGKAPTVVVGKGTYDPVTKKPIKPLLLIGLSDLSIDFYAQLDDRYARLFTLTADISLPLSLIFEGCDSVTPAIGDLKMLISNIRTANSEMLAEDPQVLADLVPAVIGLAEPALAGALKPFALPSLGAFKLKVNEVKGVGNIAGTEAYNHLGIYATLLPLNDSCAVSAPVLHASLAHLETPKAVQMRATGHGLPVPEAVLRVETSAKAGSPEFSTRVDHGLWTDFVAAKDGLLPVAHPLFLLQGPHTIEVRARMAEDAHGISEIAQVGVVIDWDPPELAFAVDAPADRLVLTAHDQLTPVAQLEFSYALGDQGFGAFGPAREIALAPAEAAGGVRVQVRDAVGNVAEAQWKAPKTADHPDADTLFPLPLRGGCSTGQGFSWLAVLALSLLLARRR